MRTNLNHAARAVQRPPLEALKCLYWTNEEKVETLHAFIAGATEHKGSWWPDWVDRRKGGEDGPGERRAGAGKGQAEGN